MQTKLARLVIISICCGLPAAQVAGLPRGTDKAEALPLHATAPKESIVTSVSPSPSSHGESLGRSPAPDCNGQPPSTDSVSTLGNRFVHSSSVVHNVQCPIPPVPDKSTLEEFHP